MVEEFERDFAAYCTTQHCVGVGSGTDALRFALMAAGVKKDSIVLTVPNTFIATTEPITQAGAQPAFIDIDEHTHNLDPAKLEKHIETSSCVHGETGALIDFRRDKPVTLKCSANSRIASMSAGWPYRWTGTITDLIVVEHACQAH